MPAMPAGVEEGVLRGLYRLREARREPPHEIESGRRVHLVGSGSLLREALRAQEILAERYGVAAEVWSATSYKELRREAMEAERWNLLHPDQEPRRPYVVELFAGDDAPIIAVSDYMKSVPDQIARWLPGRFFSLGTDGFGRSDTREALRRFFEVDAEFVALAALWQLAQRGVIDQALVRQAVADLGIDPEKPSPLLS
jgi:pyruvate dehydrogenase E1 component